MAAKQYQPVCVGVNVADVAVAVLLDPAVRSTGEPTGVPLVQALEPDGCAESGPHTENDTVPVGLPSVLFPATTALSELLCPNVIELCAGIVVVEVEVDVDAGAVTWKHSEEEVSEDAW